MPKTPRDDRLDSTVAFMRDPYRFVSRQCRRFGTDLFQARLLLQNTICMVGKDAAELIYDESRFVRAGAAPTRMQKTLIGTGGVQAMDDAAHRHRKAMFMSLMTPDQVGRLGDLVDEEWQRSARRWAGAGEVVLYAEAREVLCRAVCAWAGVPLPEADVAKRTRELTAMFDAAGSVGPRHLWSRIERRRGERWAGGLVEQIRAGALRVPEGTAAHVIAHHRDLDGRPLDVHAAAVALLNVLRPTVAIAVYAAFAAHALHEHPECAGTLRGGADGDAERFVQEVRRFYPFFPFVAARVRHDFDWNGYRFPRGTRTLLDLHGTNHDPRAWDAPETFRPDRFRTWGGSPFDFVPQGGADHHTQHRCAGEWVTIEVLKRTAVFLASRIRYDVPEQELQVDMTRLPALPRSGFVISNVKSDAYARV